MINEVLNLIIELSLLSFTLPSIDLEMKRPFSL
jgi:hypothetical protein